MDVFEKKNVCLLTFPRSINCRSNEIIYRYFDNVNYHWTQKPTRNQNRFSSDLRGFNKNFEFKCKLAFGLTNSQLMTILLLLFPTVFVLPFHLQWSNSDDSRPISICPIALDSSRNVNTFFGRRNNSRTQ